MPYDLVIRGGTLADGTGGKTFQADVAISGDRIAEIGSVSDIGRDEINARGLLVTPGFVDIHTHYDGQVIWEDQIRPSSFHGVTTVVTGNCGVGFAPCRPSDRDRLIGLMAGVEDIPEVVMAEGLSWDWETFPEYLDEVEKRPHDVDIAVHLPHSALRLYVMGQRAIDRELATADDIQRMAELAREAMAAGAIGFATSRAIQQRSADGVPIPTVRAGTDELLGIALALKDADAGVLQMLSDFHLYENVDGEFAMMRELVSQSGRPLSYTLHQRNSDPEGWRDLIGLTEQARAQGLDIHAQVGARATGTLLGFEVTLNPFMGCPTFESLSTIPFAERVIRLRDPGVRAAIIAEFAVPPVGAAAELQGIVRDFSRMFPLEDTPDYEPQPERSIEAIARRKDISPALAAYDAMLERDGSALLFQAAQDYAYGCLDVIRELIVNECTIMGLGDGGAHCGIICDASWPTFMLSHWARDRARGERLPLEYVVQRLTSGAAAAVGLHDRGVLKVGYKSDLNVIDFDKLRLCAPEVHYDLPSGGRRILQEARGYAATIVAGTIVAREGRSTGALPGRLVRGPQRAPAAS